MPIAIDRGFIERAFRSEQLGEQPCLQVLNARPLAVMNDCERVRLTISDAVNNTSYCIYSRPAPMDVFEPGYPIIKLTDYNFTDQGKDGRKRVLMISDLIILDRPQVITGTPTPLNFDVDENGLLAVARAPVANITNTNANTQKNSVAAPPAMQRQTTTPATGAQYSKSNAPAQPVNVGAVFPITSLTPYQNKWQIRARVTTKTPIKEWNKAGNTGKLFSMDLTDESGEIRATAFKAECDKYYPLMHVGKVYYISGGAIKQANKMFTSIRNDYELTFNATTEVKECHDASVANVPQKQYSFVTFDKLPNCVGQMVDVLAVVKAVGDVVEFTSKNGQQLQKRDVTLVDETNSEVTITLWGQQAQAFALPAGGETTHVVAFKGVSVKEFQGINLTTGQSSHYEFNPSIPKCHQLLGWWDEQGRINEPTKLSGQRSAGTGSNLVRAIGAIDLYNVGHGDKPDYFNVLATVTKVFADTVLYTACATDGCNKKLTDLGTGRYRCEKCNKEMDRFKWRALLTCEIADFSGSHYVTLFTEGVEEMTGTKVDQIGSLKEVDDQPGSEYAELWESIHYKRFLFRIRAKSEMYQDDVKVKWIVQAVQPFMPEKVMEQFRPLVDNLSIV